jgi:trehalose synthase
VSTEPLLSLHPQEVSVPAVSPQRFRDLLDDQEWEELQRGIVEAQEVLAGRVIWNVNSTGAGGGVAEILNSILSYSRGAGVDVRWMVIDGTPDFFRITKRIHNFVHGAPGDGGSLGEAEARVYEQVTAANAEQIAAAVRPHDAVILHDPQTAGLAARMRRTGALVIWRSHIGAEEPNELVDIAWKFLAPHLDAADACVFSRHAYVPEWANAVRTEVIQPSIDVFSPKNQDMDPETVRAILAHVGLGVDHHGSTPPSFRRRDGSPRRVDHRAEVLSTGPPPSLDAPIVVQVSRWDRLKDPVGVMQGFTEHVSEKTQSHLILAGPTVHSVADDPEGAEVLDETVVEWRQLPHMSRSRIHLACLPMVDVLENAAIVNALQRHAAVVAQKSLQEGFGLTVAEAMWKSRAVVASAVGGIRDQIEDGRTGFLLPDPNDLEAFGQTVMRLLVDRELSDWIGTAAHEHVRKHFLATRHALQYLKLFESMFRTATGDVTSSSMDSSMSSASSSALGSDRRSAKTPKQASSQ